MDRIVLFVPCAWQLLEYVVGGDGSMMLLLWGGESVEVGGYLFPSGECRVLTLGCHSCFRGMDVHSRKKIHVKTDRTFLLHTIDASLVLLPD